MEENVPKNTHIIGRVDEIDGRPNRYIEEGRELIKFVSNSQGVQIHSQQVNEIKVENH